MIPSRFLPWIAAAALVVLPCGGGGASSGSWGIGAASGFRTTPIGTVMHARTPPTPNPRLRLQPDSSPALQEDPGLPPELRKRVEVATRRAVRWLLHEQQPDGSWRSPQYGVLRGGQAYTPFVLHTLLTLPPRLSSLEKSSIDTAVAFIKSQMNEDGALGYQDKDVLEYPVYATSYAIRALGS